MRPNEEHTSPALFVLAGPNGAGKSTTARALLPVTMGVEQFVNADSIADGLSPFAPYSAIIDAARVMVERIHTLLERRVSFGFETTLAGRSMASVFRDARQRGYRIHLIFVWLRTAELALQRVADRVALGGHDVPPEIVVRRYRQGLCNFDRLYRPLATTWTLCDNSGDRIVTVAQGEELQPICVLDEERFRLVNETISNATSQG